MSRTMVRILDAVITGTMVAAAVLWGNGWLAAAVFAYGLWNYHDCELRWRRSAGGKR